MFPLLAALAVLTPAPVTKSIDDMLFTVPSGFELTETPDHTNFRRVDPSNWVLFGIYQGRPATAELAEEYAKDWNEFFGTTHVAPPTPTALALRAGLPTVAGAALTSIGYVKLIDVRVGAKVVTVIVESGNAQGFTTYATTIDAVLASLALKSAAPPQAGPAAAAPFPRPNPPDAKTSVIRMSDLVGTWDFGSSPSTTYRQLAGGAYRNAISHFFATEYALAADGTFTSRFYSTHPEWKSTGRGKWALQDGLFVLWVEQRDPEPEERRFQILSLMTKDGRTQLKLTRAGNVISENTLTDDWYRVPGE